MGGRIIPMEKYFNKNTVLIGSGILTLLPFLFDYFGTPTVCSQSYFCSQMLNDLLMVSFFISVPIFIGTLLTYFLKKEIFTFWIKFAFSWTILFVIVVLLTPHQTSLGSFITVDQKPLTALYLSLAFAILSVILIAVKSIQVYKKNK